MVCLEPVERRLLENEPERPNNIPTSFPNPSTQHTYALRTRSTLKLINKSQTNGRSAQPNASAPSKIVPSLDAKHLNIRSSSNDALDDKFLVLSRPWSIFKIFTLPFQIAVFW